VARHLLSIVPNTALAAREDAALIDLDSLLRAAGR
jgi:hypothetical protein